MYRRVELKGFWLLEKREPASEVPLTLSYQLVKADWQLMDEKIRWTEQALLGDAELDPKPQHLHMQVVPTSKNFVDKVTRHLVSVKIPVYFSHPNHGSDGAYYTLMVGSEAIGARYSWWSHPPDEWTHLGNAAFKVEKMFQQAMRRQ